MYSSLVLQEGVGDEVDEQGEGDDLLVGAAAVAGEDAGQEVGGRHEVLQPPTRLGQRQAVYWPGSADRTSIWSRLH